MTKYSEKTIRYKALAAGYSISKGFQHYMYNGSICTDCYGNRCVGYNVLDLSCGFSVWGCYDNNYDHLWTLEEVESFIRSVYEESGLEY